MIARPSTIKRAIAHEKNKLYEGSLIQRHHSKESIIKLEEAYQKSIDLRESRRV